MRWSSTEMIVNVRSAGRRIGEQVGAGRHLATLAGGHCRDKRVRVGQAGGGGGRSARRVCGSLMGRLRAWSDWAVRLLRRAGRHAWEVASDPFRLLPILAVAALLLIAVPLTITGLTRVGRDAFAWRVDSGITWRSTTGTVLSVRDLDGLRLRVQYRDGEGTRRVSEVFVGDTGSKWIDARVPIRYDRSAPGTVEVIGFGAPDPIPALLLAGAPLGCGIAAFVLAHGLWRKRRLVPVSAQPLVVLRPTFVLAGAILAAGIGAWAAGTVWARGWAAVGSAASHLGSTIFGDLLGVLVPLVAFALGCLVTAWLARHRHSDEHQGLLSSAHRLIDRAAGMVPSPEELRPEPRQEDPSAVR